MVDNSEKFICVLRFFPEKYAFAVVDTRLALMAGVCISREEGLPGWLAGLEFSFLFLNTILTSKLSYTFRTFTFESLTFRTITFETLTLRTFTLETLTLRTFTLRTLTLRTLPFKP